MFLSISKKLGDLTFGITLVHNYVFLWIVLVHLVWFNCYGDIASCCGTLLCVTIQEMNQDSTVGQVTGCGLDELGLNVGRGKRFFHSPKRQDQLCSPPSLVSSVYRRSFPWVKWPSMKVTTDLRNSAWSCTSVLPVCHRCVNRDNCTVIQECNRSIKRGLAAVFCATGKWWCTFWDLPVRTVFSSISAKFSNHLRTLSNLLIYDLKL